MTNRFLRSSTVLLGLSALMFAACGPGDPENPADMVMLGGVIQTVDASNTEVEALAVKDGRIMALGTTAEIEALVGPDTEVVELAGRFAMPGFVESHGHFTGLGNSLMILDLSTAANWDEIVAMVADAVTEAEPGEVIRGRGWHQEKWNVVPEPNVDGVPIHTSLSAVSPDNPVVLGHASGHASFVNAQALEQSGITSATADPSGGTVVKDAAGQPTGLLRETAQGLVRLGSTTPTTPEERAALFRRTVQLASQEAVTHGVTSFHDAGSSFNTIDQIKALVDEGAVPIRLNIMVRRESNASMAERLGDYFMDGYGDGYLTVRSIKRQIDGALGPHGAWLLDPYEDLAGNAGLNLESVADIEETARVAVANGFQVNVHAIGDRANREVLDIYERVWAESEVDGSDLRWRIEHAQHLNPADVPRFAELGVIAAMQGIHGTSDGPWVLRRLGPERAESGAYLWRSLWDLGVVVTNGTDVPVERIDPIASYHATVTRMMSNGETFFPDQRLTRIEGLRSYTINGAYAGFEEDRIGSLEVGKFADIAVLSQDLLTVADDQILDTQVEMTLVGGAVVYDRGR